MKDKYYDWEFIARSLWQKLDDISTCSDIFKTDYEGFHDAVYEKCEQRHRFMHSPDGYSLIRTPVK